MKLISPPLGHPIPMDEHACSVALPRWSDVVGYEENNPIITSTLSCGYPRFFYHPYITSLINHTTQRYSSEKNLDVERLDCIIMPCRKSANRCRDFIVKACLSVEEQHIEGLISVDNCHDQDDSASAVDMDSQRHRMVKVFDLQTSTNVHAVIFPRDDERNCKAEAKSYWQHTGEIVSSRRAACALNELNVAYERITSKHLSPQIEGNAIRDHDGRKYTELHSSALPTKSSENEISAIDKLITRISSIAKQPESNVFLCPSGMSAIHSAIRLSRRRRLDQSKLDTSICKEGTCIVYGFPYIDTLKMCSRPELSDGCEFYGHGDARDLTNLEFMLSTRAKMSENGDAGISCLVTEFPSNPLLNIPDLLELRRLANEYKFMIIVDDTLGNFANLDLLKGGVADVICTSLTKAFNGVGDAMGGSVVISSDGKFNVDGQLCELMGELNEGRGGKIYESDAIAIEINSRTFIQRSSRINETAERIADWLKTRPEIDKVLYPKYSNPTLYNKFLSDNSESNSKHVGGYGGLLSIILKPEACVESFYDSLTFAKGPSLGTNFTLCCPYTLLAHYHELDFAKGYGVDAELIRVSVGLEDYEIAREGFEVALECSVVKGREKAKAKMQLEETKTKLEGIVGSGSGSGVKSFSTLSRASPTFGFGGQKRVFSSSSKPTTFNNISPLLTRSLTTTASSSSSSAAKLRLLPRRAAAIYSTAVLAGVGLTLY